VVKSLCKQQQQSYTLTPEQQLQQHQQQQPYTLTPEQQQQQQQQQQQLIIEEVMDFEFEKYKCRFFSNWLELSKVFIGSVLPNSSDKKEVASDWLLGLIDRFV
jgi:hypothetical protein